MGRAILQFTACAAHHREAQITRMVEGELHHCKINIVAPFAGICVFYIILAQNGHPAMPMGEEAW